MATRACIRIIPPTCPRNLPSSSTCAAHTATVRKYSNTTHLPHSSSQIIPNKSCYKSLQLQPTISNRTLKSSPQEYPYSLKIKRFPGTYSVDNARQLFEDAGFVVTHIKQIPSENNNSRVENAFILSFRGLGELLRAETFVVKNRWLCGGESSLRATLLPTTIERYYHPKDKDFSQLMQMRLKGRFYYFDDYKAAETGLPELISTCGDDNEGNGLLALDWEHEEKEGVTSPIVVLKIASANKVAILNLRMMQSKQGVTDADFKLPNPLIEALNNKDIQKVALGNQTFRSFEKILNVHIENGLNVEQLPIIKYRSTVGGIANMCAMFVNARMPRLESPLLWNQPMTAVQKNSLALDVYAIRCIYFKVRRLALDNDSRATIQKMTSRLLEMWRGMLILL